MCLVKRNYLIKIGVKVWALVKTRCDVIGTGMPGDISDNTKLGSIQNG